MKGTKALRNIAVTAVFLLTCSVTAFAQDAQLPRSIDVYVPARAGGGTDVMARTVANQISKSTGSNLVILNNVDGNGIVALETVRNTKPDGKTIMQFHSSMIILSSMGKYKYDATDDFTVIAVGVNPVEAGYVLLTPLNSPYNNLKEFIEYARKNPGKILAGVQTGGSTHLMVGMLEKAAGIKLRAVEAGSDTEKLTALAGNNVNVAFVNPNQAKQYLEAGKLKALGVMSTDGTGKRTGIVPNVPSLVEQGVKVSYNTMSFILGPKGMDKALVEKLNALYRDASVEKSVDELLAKAGMQLRFFGVDEGLRLLRTQAAELHDAVDAIGMAK